MLNVRSLNENDSLEELTDLIHRSYRQLADLGFRYWGTHQTVADTKKRVSKGSCYIGLIGNQIISTVTFYSPGISGGHPWFEQKNIAKFGQFAVEPAYQQQGIGGKMMDLIEQKAVEMNAGEIACDTAEGATHLIRMYRNRGYRIVGKADWDITNFISVILSKKLKES